MRALSAQDAPRVVRLLPGESEAAGPARRSAVERLAADRAKYVRGLPGKTRDPGSEGISPRTGEGQADHPRPPASVPGAVARRAIARKPLRPDSLVIYRQKCEFVRGPGTDSFGGGLVKKLFPGPGKDKTLASPESSLVGAENVTRGERETLIKPGPAATPRCPERPSVRVASPVRSSVSVTTPSPAVRLSVPARTPASPARPSLPAATPSPPLRPTVPAASPTSPARPSDLAATPTSPAPSSVRAAPRSPELRALRRRGLQRSQSDLSSRYSKSAAEFDTFFQFCGLEPEVVEALGRENFSAGSDRLALKVRSVSVATSDSGFSLRSGGDEGLQEEELVEQVPSATSVIERNARIIKWLYTCKRAKEPPAPRRQGPA